MPEYSGIGDKMATIPYRDLYPHYSDRRFTERSGGMTVFLAEGKKMHKEHGTDFVEGASYEYSDRLVQWNGPDKCEEAAKKAKAVAGNVDSAQYYEEYLRILLNNPKLDLVHIVSGVNRGNGYPYQVFGYTVPSESKS